MSALDVMRRVLTAYETHDLLGMEAHMQELRAAIAELECQPRIECSRCGRILADVPPAGDTFAERWRNVTGAIKGLL